MGRTTTIIIAAAAAIVVLAGVLLFMLNNNSERDADQMNRDLAAMPLPSTTGDNGVPALPAGGPTGATTSFKGQQLVVVSWGGAYTKSQVEAYHKPWEAKTGAKINSIDY